MLVALLGHCLHAQPLPRAPSSTLVRPPSAGSAGATARFLDTSPLALRRDVRAAVAMLPRSTPSTFPPAAEPAPDIESGLNNIVPNGTAHAQHKGCITKSSSSSRP